MTEIYVGLIGVGVGMSICILCKILHFVCC